MEANPKKERKVSGKKVKNSVVLTGVDTEAVGAAEDVDAVGEEALVVVMVQDTTDARDSVKLVKRTEKWKNLMKTTAQLGEAAEEDGVEEAIVVATILVLENQRAMKVKKKYTNVGKDALGDHVIADHSVVVAEEAGEEAKRTMRMNHPKRLKVARHHLHNSSSNSRWKMPQQPKVQLNLLTAKG